MPFSTKQKFAEFYRISFEESEVGLWLAMLNEPLPVNIPLEEQEEHLFKHAYLVECNKAFAEMYGYSDPSGLTGARFPQLVIISDPENLKAMQIFLASDYQVKNVQTHERARNGEEKYFLNEVRGIVEEGFLVRFWGRQEDITADKLLKQTLAHLTPRQLAVLKLTVEGKTLKEISNTLNTNQKLVDTTRTRLKKTFGVGTIPELVARVVQLGVIDFADKL